LGVGVGVGVGVDLGVDLGVGVDLVICMFDSIRFPSLTAFPTSSDASKSIWIRCEAYRC
jgi:hypothetical protein